MFRNEEELRELAKSGLIDVRSMDALNNLEQKQCLAVGNITAGYPLFLKVNPQTGVMMGGESRRLVP